MVGVPVRVDVVGDTSVGVDGRRLTALVAEMAFAVQCFCLSGGSKECCTAECRRCGNGRVQLLISGLRAAGQALEGTLHEESVLARAVRDPVALLDELSGSRP